MPHWLEMVFVGLAAAVAVIYLFVKFRRRFSGPPDNARPAEGHVKKTELTIEGRSVRRKKG